MFADGKFVVRENMTGYGQFFVTRADDVDVAPETPEEHDELAKLFQASPAMLARLRSLRTDCEMALSGDWDKGDEGFEAMRDSITTLLTLSLIE